MENNKFNFKQLFWIYTFFVIPFSILQGMLALLQIVPVVFNDTPRYGFFGFIISILFIPFLGLLLSGTNWIALHVGNSLYQWFLKVIRQKK